MFKMNGKALTLLALGVVAIAAAGQEATLLRRTYTAGKTDDYKITSVTNMTMTLPTGEQSMKINSESKYSVKVNSVDDKGVATVENTAELVKFESDSEMAQKPPTTKNTTKGTLDAMNAFTEAADSKKSGSINELMGGVNGEMLSVRLNMPEKAVKVGDTWDVTVKKSVFVYPSDQTMKATLVGEKEIDGVKYWNVTLSGTLKLEPNVVEAKKLIPEEEQGQLGQIDFTVKGTEDVKCDILVEKATGRTTSSTVKSNVKAVMDASAMGFTVDFTASTDSTLKLDK